MIYLDSAAVVKLVRVEAESAELTEWLEARKDVPVVSSNLIEVEVPRALRRTAPDSLPRVPVVIANLYRLEVDPTVRATAAAFPNPGLRSLDAIHLATALVVARELQAFVTYDVRLRDAARQAGLPVANPGQGTDLPLKPA